MSDTPEKEFNMREFRSVSASFFKIGEKDYKWRGLFGSVLESIEEKEVKKKEVRYICGIPFEAYTVKPIKKIFFLPTRYEVHWVPVFYIEIDWIRSFKKALLLASE